MLVRLALVRDVMGWGPGTQRPRGLSQIKRAKTEKAETQTRVWSLRGPESIWD